MNPMMILQMMFGNKAQEMMNKWNSMSPEQKQAELSKVSGMTREQQIQYLQGMGLDTKVLEQFQQQPQQNSGRKFNY